MAQQKARAVYEAGHLRVLDPVNLSEGELVQVMIMREQDRTRSALGDLLVDPEPNTDDGVDEAVLRDEIDVAMRGQAPISAAIIQERQDGP